MSIAIPDSAVFVPPLPSDVTGVDFLGIASVNEYLIGLCFPGISTYTRYMRVYSAMSWLTWRFAESLKSEGGGKGLSEKELSSRFRRYREKVEVLFTLGNASHSQIAGSSRMDHIPKDDRRFTLEFESLGKMAISWFDAAVYGPSLHSLSGLGFMERAPGRAHRPTELGQEIAVALDVVLQKSSHYGELADIQRNVGTRVLVNDLGKRWAVRESTARERACFKRAFFPPDAGVEGATNLPANRVAMGHLIVRAMELMGGKAGEESVRRAIARGVTPKGKALEISGCEKTQAIWAVLQIRQLQRVAHEALLQWLEATLLEMPKDLTARTPNALGALAASQTAAYLNVKETDPLDRVLGRIRLKEGNGNYFLAGMIDPEVDPFEVLNQLLVIGTASKPLQLPGAALYALGLCALQTRALSTKQHHSRWLGTGGPYRLSLSSLPGIFEAYRSESIGTFARFLLESCVIGQHLKITNRKGFEPNKNKFRFMPGEEGLRLFIRPDQRTGLGVTGDRLQNAMELMSDCGVLEWDDQAAAYSIRDGL